MPPGIGNPFEGLPLADLQDLQAKYVQVLKDIATAGQSYQFPGRNFTRADLVDVKTTLGQLTDAIALATGTGKQFAQARMAGPLNCYDPQC